jgi:uracil-DNA glycosylase family 4
MAESTEAINREVVSCRACPRLVEWRERVAREKTRRFADREYWGKPIPSFGDPAARLWIIGLAPAAHGANRTGRIFTGDRSGDWLFGALYRAGFANQPTATEPGDGLELTDCFISAAVRCAPPQNKPTKEEFDACRPYLIRECAALTRAQVILCLGQIAFTESLRMLAAAGVPIPRPRPRFAHAAEHRIGADTRADTGGRRPPKQRPPKQRPPVLLCSYHPSQQNTFTGRLTQPMLDAVLSRARRLIDGSL